jgi:hypothetical protein
MNMYRTDILSEVLLGVAFRLWPYGKNRSLKRMFGHNKEKETAENCIMTSFIICILREILLERSDQ